MSRTPESTKAYQAGLCVDCKTEPHSAGRPRCDECHVKYRRGDCTPVRRVAPRKSKWHETDSEAAPDLAEIGVRRGVHGAAG